MTDIENKMKKNRIVFNFDFLLSFVLAASLFLYFLKIPPVQDESVLIILSFIATAFVFGSALQSLKDKKISVDLLASIALIVSLIEREWVSVIFINLMIAAARTFTGYVRIKSHSAIDGLMKLKPKEVKLLVDGEIRKIPLNKIKAGDRIVVELGERIPIDGLVEDGEAEIDESSLTGESLPIFKKAGDNALSFTFVVSGHLVIRAEKIGKETTFEKIVNLVEQSQLNKAPIYTLIDKFANWYIVLTIVGASLVYLISRDVHLVLALLLVSCADDLAIATPLALMTAVTHSARHGAIIKGGDFLEALAKVKIIIFDKTGTLTHGKLKIAKIISKNKNILEIATAASACSSHPVARAIINYAKEKNIIITKADSFAECGGKGISAIYKGQKALVGKLSFFQEENIEIKEEELTAITEETTAGSNVTLVGYAGKLIGLLILADELKPKMKQVIEELKKLGIKKTVMLTGDNEKVAEMVSRETGIDEFHANLLPAGKLAYLQKSLSKEYKVAMIGDGVNDAPVLALADIGIVMGAIGSDAAIEAADVALMKDDLSQIPELIRISRAAMQVIRQNLIMWGILNVLGLILVFAHVLDPSGAAAYNFISDFIPIFNSLRLFR
ncbi:MAG: cation-translocating P-type ATPase [bacterium]